MHRLLAVISFLGLASVGQAAFIACTPSQQDTIVNSAGVTTPNFTCTTGSVGVGSTVQIRVSGTFQENAAPVGQTYSVLSTTSSPSFGGISIGAANCTASGIGSAQNQALGNCIGLGAVSILTTALAGPSFTVTVTGGAGSTPLPFNASASVAFEVTPPASGVPEPTSMVLLGSGFLALGLTARLRKKARV